VVDHDHVVVEDREGILNGLLRLFDLDFSQHQTRHLHFIKDTVDVIPA